MEELKSRLDKCNGKMLDLSGLRLKSLPTEVFQFSETLELLNLGGNDLSELPLEFRGFKALRILFFANNAFTAFPKVVGELPSLYMVSFKSNRIESIDEGCFPTGSSIGWLILTDNKIERLPSTIRNLSKLRKCMLAGNRLTELPEEMQECREIELLRIASNRLRAIPTWLLDLPKLSWLAIAGNDCVQSGYIDSLASEIEEFEINDFELLEKIGEGASGTVHRALWKPENTVVALKQFKSCATSDGVPLDEMKAAIAVGRHPNTIEVLGRIAASSDSDQDQQSALVLALVPPSFIPLGNPPSFESVTRDTYDDSRVFSPFAVLDILTGIASVCTHLHRIGISHGDLYAHNILINQSLGSQKAVGKPLLCDFGAASFYSTLPFSLEPLEVRAFGCLAEELIFRIVEKGHTENPSDCANLVRRLKQLAQECANPVARKRPTFHAISKILEIERNILINRFNTDFYSRTVGQNILTLGVAIAAVASIFIMRSYYIGRK